MHDINAKLRREAALHYLERVKTEIVDAYCDADGGNVAPLKCTAIETLLVALDRLLDGPFAWDAYSGVK